MGMKSSANRPVIISILVGAIIIAVGLAVGLALGLRDDDDCSDNNVGTSTGGTTGGTNGGTNNGSTSYKSESVKYRYAAVVADSEIASDIGNDMLVRHRGNAIDATVAALLATGVLSAHSAGIGGGSFYVIYYKDKGWFAADSRETAPLAATEEMYLAPENRNKSLYGGMASGIPGEVRGLYEVHKEFGKVSWREVVRPTIRLCQDGVPITEAVYNALTRLVSDRDKTEFKEYFDENKNIHPVGFKVKLPRLAKTYEKIAEDPMSFYNGSLAGDIVHDIQEEGGIITLEDLANYTVKWSNTTKLSLPGGLDVHSMPAPGSGLVLSYILSILSGYGFGPEDMASDQASILATHRIVEAMKFAFGKRTELGDDSFVNITEDIEKMLSLAYGEETRRKITDDKTHETGYYHPTFSMNNDQGTAHISVLDSQGNAVSVTSTINTYFGSRVKGNRTGIVFNNEMDDFSTPNTTNYFQLPASPANFIQPGKRPFSSMSPAIVWDDNAKKVKLVTGAAGGSKITTATALNIMDTLWFGMSLPDSVDRPRLHHQLVPPVIQVETGYPEAIIKGLKAKGHETADMQGKSVVQAALVVDDGVVGTADYRKGGEPSGF